LKDSSFTSLDTLGKSDFRSNHNIATRFEREFDSTKVLIIKGNLRFSHTDARNIQNQLFAQIAPTNALNIDNQNHLNAYRLTSSMIFRHRFKKKGRSVAISGGYNNSLSDGTENLFSINRFFQATTFTEQVRQLNTNENATGQLKSSFLFTEPLSKKWFWESFYNFSQTRNEVRRQVNDPERNNERVDLLSVFYDNKILYNRIGSSFRYAHQGVNITSSLAAQQLILNGSYSIDRNLPLLTTPIRNVYMNFTPNITANIDLPNNKFVEFSYGYSVKEPQLSDLQPVPNVNNPAFRAEGNPNLQPERSHHATLGFNYWNPSNFANFDISVEYQKLDNQIVYAQTIENIDKIGLRMTTRPENMAGGQHINSWFWANYPLIKTKLTISGNGNIHFTNTPSLVNRVQNQTNTIGGNIGMSLNITPNPKLILSLRGNSTLTNIDYSIQKEQNQKIRNQSIDASIKWNFIPKTYLESNFNYASFKNERFGFDQKIPIWNLSIRRLFMKENKIEMRLAAFDLLNRTLSITQSGSQNYVIQTTAQTLARYFMLSLTYNVKGHEDKLKKEDQF
jgi:hypothetical protein